MKSNINKYENNNIFTNLYQVLQQLYQTQIPFHYNAISHLLNESSIYSSLYEPSHIVQVKSLSHQIQDHSSHSKADLTTHLLHHFGYLLYLSQYYHPLF